MHSLVEAKGANPIKSAKNNVIQFCMVIKYHTTQNLVESTRKKIGFQIQPPLQILPL